MPNFNTFILLFGLNPDNYYRDYTGTIKTDKGWIINLKQSTEKEKKRVLIIFTPFFNN